VAEFLPTYDLSSHLYDGLLLGVEEMFEIVAAVLIVLWLLGVMSAYTLGGFIHMLLVIGLIIIVVRVLQGRKPIP